MNKFVDEKEEQAYWTQVQAINDYKAMLQKKHYPDNYKFSEGFVFDIINPKNIIDVERNEKYDNLVDRKKRYKYRWKYDKIIKDRDEIKDQAEFTQKINRVYQNRELEELEHG